LILLATQAEPQMREYAHRNLGRLVQPRHYARIADTAERGVPWAADNDAFGGWDEAKDRAFERMLDAIAGIPGCLFVTSPDVVGEAGLTDLLFEEWAPQIAARGLPVAYVLQEDGLEYEPRGIPWGSIAALFVGCALAETKFSPRVAELCAEAKRRGKWVHAGRVNTARRARHFAACGVDSFDGTKWVRWRRTYMKEGLELAAAPIQPALMTTTEEVR
jgi:hypothetical protein